MTRPAPVPITSSLQAGLLRRWLPARPRAAHKGDFGPLAVIGGDVGHSGAVLLASETALRAGAGVTAVGCAPETAAGLWIARPELMARALREREDLAALLTFARALVIGPGLGQGPWAQRLWPHLAEAAAPQVMDADGLNWLAREPHRHDCRILTPHPGEAARLLGCSIADIQADRAGAVVALVDRYGGVVILKGAGTLISDGERCWRCEAGNPGMATPGMGDVLAGLTGALLAQQLPLFEAAALAADLHARAGDLAARAGERGLLASDLWLPLRQLVNPGAET